MNSVDVKLEAQAAASFIRESWSSTPRLSIPKLGIILGTGSGQIADAISIDHSLDYDSIPNFPQSTALGHQGRLVCGTLAGHSVVAMQGRFHAYEGHSYDKVTLPIHMFHELGIERLLITNAAGGVNPKFCSGDLMAITSHVDLMLRTQGIFATKTTSVADHMNSPALTSQRSFDSVQRTVFRADKAYDPKMIDLAIEVGRKNDFVIHRGTYAGLLGPNYETRAEYRMLRKIGGDVAGMSTIAEVAAAALYQMRVLAISVVTNVAKPDALQATSGQEVIDAAQIAAPNLLAIAKCLAAIPE